MKMINYHEFAHDAAVFSGEVEAAAQDVRDTTTIAAIASTSFLNPSLTPGAISGAYSYTDTVLEDLSDGSRDVGYGKLLGVAVLNYGAGQIGSQFGLLSAFGAGYMASNLENSILGEDQNNLNAGISDATGAAFAETLNFLNTVPGSGLLKALAEQYVSQQTNNFLNQSEDDSA